MKCDIYFLQLSTVEVGSRLLDLLRNFHFADLHPLEHVLQKNQNYHLKHQA